MTGVTFVNILASGRNIAWVVGPSFITDTESFNSVRFAISMWTTFYIFTRCFARNTWWSSNKTTLIYKEKQNMNYEKKKKNRVNGYRKALSEKTYFGHSHLYDPSVFIHNDRSPQMLAFVRHSSISTHTDPCGSKPFWQKHCPSIHSAFVVQSKLL